MGQTTAGKPEHTSCNKAFCCFHVCSLLWNSPVGGLWDAKHGWIDDRNSPWTMNLLRASHSDGIATSRFLRCIQRSEHISLFLVCMCKTLTNWICQSRPTMKSNNYGTWADILNLLKCCEWKNNPSISGSNSCKHNEQFNMHARACTFILCPPVADDLASSELRKSLDCWLALNGHCVGGAAEFNTAHTFAWHHPNDVAWPKHSCRSGAFLSDCKKFINPLQIKFYDTPTQLINW